MYSMSSTPWWEAETFVVPAVPMKGHLYQEIRKAEGFFVFSLFKVLMILVRRANIYIFALISS